MWEINFRTLWDREIMDLSQYSSPLSLQKQRIDIWWIITWTDQISTSTFMMISTRRPIQKKARTIKSLSICCSDLYAFIRIIPSGGRARSVLWRMMNIAGYGVHCKSRLQGMCLSEKIRKLWNGSGRKKSKRKQKRTKKHDCCERHWYYGLICYAKLMRISAWTVHKTTYSWYAPFVRFSPHLLSLSPHHPV